MRGAQELDEKFAALLDAQIRSGDETKEMKREAKERAAELDIKFAALADAQMRTEETMRGLAATVERHIADGHGGRKDKEEG